MDIVERLAQWAENDMKAEAIALEAKYEIERRLKESRLYWDAFQKAADEIERLRNRLEKPTPAMLEAGRAANRMVASNALGLACIAPDAAWAAMANLVLSEDE